MNDDLLIEILTRLPLKSLFRFKCVSKGWCRLVSDDYLRRRLPLITSAIFYRCDVDADEPRYACSSSSSDGGLDDCNLSFFPFRQISTIVDCCNGLILCYSTSLSEFHVLNPATKRWSNIPKPLKRTHRSILAFDPSRSSEFKVISFTGWLADGAELEVFASETGNWVEHEVCWGLNSDATLSTTICFFGDTLYILAYPKYVVGVDLTDMTCRMTELPESMEPGGRIGQYDGALCYTHRDGDQLKFWMLRDSNGSNWVLKSAISTKLMVERSLKTSHHSSSSTSFALPVQLKFLAFHPQREVVYLWLPGKIISYDLSKNSLEEAYKFRNEMETAYFFQIWLFPFSCYMSDCLVKI